MGVQPPIAVMLSLVGVKGYSIQIDQHLPPEAQNSIDRDDLLIPEILLPEFTSDEIAIAQTIRPIFETLWQSCNYRGCPYYSKTGEWEPVNMRNRLGEVWMA